MIDRRNTTLPAGHYDNGVNIEKLRSDRLSKTQAAMKKLGIGSLLLTDIVHIRYTTGISVMPLWTSTNFAHYALIPAEGKPYLFEYPESVPVLSHLDHVHLRSMSYWQYRFSGGDPKSKSKKWAQEIKEILANLNLHQEPMGIDNLDFYGHQALRDENLKLRDADEALQAARVIKTDDEIKLMLLSASVCEAALYKLEHSIEP